MDAIRTDGLVKKYGWFFSRRKIVAVNSLSLEVKANQIFGFLGPNGAGKTTTIKILLGLVIPDAGTASIFETAVGDKTVKGRVGFLPDNPCFYNHLSGREFVAFCGKLMHLDRMERYR
ncbi:MAG: ATP-binding cassette domain-containing protein, partial [Planctomycetes bacterium]|nr:ATP-binding cassette domain-containing protein [Planctomycetota bacterium]